MCLCATEWLRESEDNSVESVLSLHHRVGSGESNSSYQACTATEPSCSSGFFHLKNTLSLGGMSNTPMHASSKMCILLRHRSQKQLEAVLLSKAS